MKSSELIRQIQEADPTGEVEVCIRNEDIDFVERSPAYYDGPLEILERDDGGHIIGARYLQQSEGFKLKIRPRSIQDCIAQDIDFPVDYSDLDEGRQRELRISHDRWRRTVLDIQERVSCDSFVAWVQKLLKRPGITGEAVRFHKENYHKWDQELPGIDPERRLSENDRWEIFWTNTIKFVFHNDQNLYRIMNLDD